MTHLDVFTILAGVAWADGALAESEANMLCRAILIADLTPDERDQAGLLLEAPVTVPDHYVATLPPESRRDLYRAACRMAIADKVLSESELGLLVKLREVLEISTDAAHEIERDIPGFDRRTASLSPP